MATENRVGEVLASKYRLEELLGSGGMGHVYRAVNEHVGRAVAIKVLRKEHAENAQVVERFLREARAANLVRHPNVVDVLDIGREDGGAPFIVQELLDGEDLAHLVERRGGKLPVQEVCDLLLPVIEAVAEAHHRGVVHRDIKPDNVFLVKSSRGVVPKLLDFGISKVRAPDLRATEVGIMMGTPAYMAPEQVQGARDADARSDVWALGVMMFELIAGRMPFDGMDAPALFFAIATRDAPTLLDVKAAVTPPVSRVVERCLRRRPDERYPSAAELGRDLRHVMDGSELEATGKRSVPPLPGRLVPDLVVPRAPPAGVPVPAPSSSGDLVTDTSPDAQASLDGKAETSPGVASHPGEKSGDHRVDLPSLIPPPKRVRAARAPTPAEAPAPREKEARSTRLAPDASMSGVMLAPGPSATKATGSHASWGVRPTQPRAQGTETIIGLAVVGLVAIFGTGLLMQLAHRPGGWPVAQFFSVPSTGGVVIHGLFSLLSVVVGGSFCQRGLRHWRGELGGGPGNAVVQGVFAAGAFFAAIELASAVV